MNDSLKHRVGQEKLHQAVRSLEALILPETGNTKKQFIHRCQTFAKANDNAVKILGEIFDMRSDSEHVHDWARSLVDSAIKLADPEKARDDIAWQQTRQIEALARFAYTRIMLDDKIRGHFKDETVLEDFWKKIDDGTRRKIWGTPFDIESIPLVLDYDGFDRARMKGP